METNNLTVESSFELKKIIANNLTELRKLHKWTQAELAMKLNYSDKAISKWERGEAIPDITTLVEIAKLYNVTLDYLVSEKTLEEKQELFSKDEETITASKLAITLLSALMPWFVACVLFFYANYYNHDVFWVTFIYAIPASAIIMLIFNSIWGKKIYKYILLSLLVWSVLACFYFTFLVYLDRNIWLIYILGIPAQIAVILWSQIHHKKRVITNKKS